MTPDRPGRLVALNHVGISVRDLEAARGFWVEALGATPHGAFGWPVGSAPADESLALVDTAAEVVLLRTDVAYMELFAFSSPAPADRPTGSPGVTELTWATGDLAATLRAVTEHGGAVLEDDLVSCPDGTRIRLVAAVPGRRGLISAEVLVAERAGHPLDGLPGPVSLRLREGARPGHPSPVDHGVNHVCLDVDGIGDVRAALRGMRWHHPVTESSGGAAAVCYGTTADGVLVELLESRSDSAFFARCHLVGQRP